MMGVMYAILTVKSAPAVSVNAETFTDNDRLSRPADLERRINSEIHPALRAVYDRSQSPTSRMLHESSEAAKNGYPPSHVAGLGATLFTDHLISVEIVGAILFVALVGAVCIATPKPPIRPQVPPTSPS